MADRNHVHVWPEQDRESLGSKRIAAQAPAPVSQAENLELDLRGVHPADLLDKQLGEDSSVSAPDFGRLIHDPDVAQRELKQKKQELFCGRCLKRSRKKKHTRKPGCRRPTRGGSSSSGVDGDGEQKTT